MCLPCSTVPCVAQRGLLVFLMCVCRIFQLHVLHSVSCATSSGLGVPAPVQEEPAAGAEPAASAEGCTSPSLWTTDVGAVARPLHMMYSTTPPASSVFIFGGRPQSRRAGTPSALGGRTTMVPWARLCPWPGPSKRRTPFWALQLSEAMVRRRYIHHPAVFVTVAVPSLLFDPFIRHCNTSTPTGDVK
jgi:hypothetical protein